MAADRWHALALVHWLQLYLHSAASSAAGSDNQGKQNEFVPFFPRRSLSPSIASAAHILYIQMAPDSSA